MFDRYELDRLSGNIKTLEEFDAPSIEIAGGAITPSSTLQFLCRLNKQDITC